MISEVPETPEAIRALKSHLQSNYQKFFKETFKDKGFQPKWEALQKIRHRVAHNNLFTSADLNRAEQIAQDLRQLIQEAIRLVDDVTLAAEDKEAIKESLMDRGLFEEISPDKFLAQLRQAEDYFAKENGFVGLQHFVKTHLGDQGFDYRATYELVQRLAKEKRIEVYKIENPRGSFPTSAIRTTAAAERQPDV